MICVVTVLMRSAQFSFLLSSFLRHPPSFRRERGIFITVRRLGRLRQIRRRSSACACAWPAGLRSRPRRSCANPAARRWARKSAGCSSSPRRAGACRPSPNSSSSPPAARSWCARPSLPALAGGGIVVCDRFLDSTTVYQGVARRLDPAVRGRHQPFRRRRPPARRDVPARPAARRRPAARATNAPGRSAAARPHGTRTARVLRGRSAPATCGWRSLHPERFVVLDAACRRTNIDRPDLGPSDRPFPWPSLLPSRLITCAARTPADASATPTCSIGAAGRRSTSPRRLAALVVRADPAARVWRIQDVHVVEPESKSRRIAHRADARTRKRPAPARLGRRRTQGRHHPRGRPAQRAGVQRVSQNAGGAARRFAAAAGQRAAGKPAGNDPLALHQGRRSTPPRDGGERAFHPEETALRDLLERFAREHGAGPARVRCRPRTGCCGNSPACLPPRAAGSRPRPMPRWKRRKPTTRRPPTAAGSPSARRTTNRSPRRATSPRAPPRRELWRAGGATCCARRRR